MAIAGVSGCAQVAPAPEPVSLAGTSWQLVTFRSGDGSVLIPDDSSKYTVALQADGTASVRFDCNRGRGTWSSRGKNLIEFGPLALTRVMCAPGSLHDQLARRWAYIRTYAFRDGRLFLSLMADGGSFELLPLPGSGG